MQFKCGNSFLCIYFCSKLHHKWLNKRFREICFSRRSANFRLLTSLYSYTFYYRLVINPINTRVFRLKLPGGARKIFPLIHVQKFCIKFAFSGEHWRGLSIEKYKKSHILNFSAESKQKQFTTWYSPLHFILLKMTISSPLKWEINTASRSSVFIIGQSDTRNREYLISWL